MFYAETLQKLLEENSFKYPFNSGEMEDYEQVEAYVNVLKQLEDKGYNVQIQKSSKPKIKTDSELVVQVRMLGEKRVLLVVGDFLINVEGNYGLV